MYVDTDVIFMTSAFQLWERFGPFKSDIVAAFIYESETPRGIYQTSLGYPFYKPHGKTVIPYFLLHLCVFMIGEIVTKLCKLKYFHTFINLIACKKNVWSGELILLF